MRDPWQDGLDPWSHGRRTADGSRQLPSSGGTLVHAAVSTHLSAQDLLRVQLVEGVARGSAAGGATRQAAAAMVAAAIRTVLSGDAAPLGAHDDIRSEIDLRERLSRPSLQSKVAGERPSGHARASRNIAQHLLLGAGAPALRQASHNPQASQRGGKRLTDIFVLLDGMCSLPPVISVAGGILLPSVQEPIVWEGQAKYDTLTDDRIAEVKLLIDSEYIELDGPTEQCDTKYVISRDSDTDSDMPSLVPVSPHALDQLSNCFFIGDNTSAKGTQTDAVDPRLYEMVDMLDTKVDVLMRGLLLGAYSLAATPSHDRFAHDQAKQCDRRDAGVHAEMADMNSQYMPTRSEETVCMSDWRSLPAHAWSNIYSIFDRSRTPSHEIAERHPTHDSHADLHQAFVEQYALFRSELRSELQNFDISQHSLEDHIKF